MHPAAVINHARHKARFEASGGGSRVQNSRFKGYIQLVPLFFPPPMLNRAFGVGLSLFLFRPFGLKSLCAWGRRVVCGVPTGWQARLPA